VVVGLLDEVFCEDDILQDLVKKRKGLRVCGVFYVGFFGDEREVCSFGDVEWEVRSLAVWSLNNLTSCKGAKGPSVVGNCQIRSGCEAVHEFRSI
jgi:hypothetical protein